MKINLEKLTRDFAFCLVQQSKPEDLASDKYGKLWMTQIANTSVEMAKTLLDRLDYEIAGSKLAQPQECNKITSLDWRHISCAPKDGTPVLLFWPHWSAIPVVGFYKNGEWESLSSLYGEKDPTHWMPLPEPPKEGE